MLKFYWNGIKEDDGKLQTCTYSNGKLCNFPDGTITIYKKEYSHFSEGVRQAFTVTNDSEIQSDYIVTDVIHVTPLHTLYPMVEAAWLKYQQHQENRWSKRTKAFKKSPYYVTS